ncbi:hypothetical protein [Novosphingobium sp. JCM 18896]|uniref:hypothetical protein n=1 Tax=Novosphingobium sp. JCM 18896 TaxID=2989731 RepID=UPI002223A580|nr:hypothetical protein [Novosphingobium sp. JCM 18896]MCW1431587.1 hypothetical protein [Novosphingobium sp. JCM 18896]
MDAIVSVEPSETKCGEKRTPEHWVKRAWNGFLGFNPPDFRDPRIFVPIFSKPNEDQIRCAEMIAKQIEVEQGLASTRMTWNLTFQGFTIAAYALVASSNGTTPAKGILGWAIGLSSGFVAYVTMRGIVASQVQRKYLKDCWAANELTRFFPEPFSISKTSSHGRWPSYAICVVLMVMWAILLLTSLWSTNDDPTKVQLVRSSKVSAPILVGQNVRNFQAKARTSPQPPVFRSTLS